MYSVIIGMLSRIYAAGRGTGTLPIFDRTGGDFVSSLTTYRAVYLTHHQSPSASSEIKGCKDIWRKMRQKTQTSNVTKLLCLNCY